MIPASSDALVRLDLAEFNGKVPRAPHSRERFERLRDLVRAGNDPPVKLVIEFSTILFELELRHAR